MLCRYMDPLGFIGPYSAHFEQFGALELGVFKKSTSQRVHLICGMRETGSVGNHLVRFYRGYHIDMIRCLTPGSFTVSLAAREVVGCSFTHNIRRTRSYILYRFRV